MESSYIPLHVMSEYSIGESAARISELIEKAESLKMKALALTDTTLSGSLEFYRQCLKHDIKPILGQKIILNNSYIILLCKDFEAYRIL
ncbi:MAG TPA: PHP domain-containing protein, partial [Bacillota bacterium]|nr:PHP domain-containing protein [Bacillota bacterium]